MPSSHGVGALLGNLSVYLMLQAAREQLLAISGDGPEIHSALSKLSIVGPLSTDELAQQVQKVSSLPVLIALPLLSLKLRLPACQQDHLHFACWDFAAADFSLPLESRRWLCSKGARRRGSCARRACCSTGGCCWLEMV